MGGAQPRSGYSRVAVWDNGGDPLGQFDVSEAAEYARILEPRPEHLPYYFWDVAVCRGDDETALSAFDDLVPEPSPPGRGGGPLRAARVCACGIRITAVSEQYRFPACDCALRLSLRVPADAREADRGEVDLQVGRRSHRVHRAERPHRRHLSMGPGTAIGGRNVITNLKELRMAEGSSIGSGNLIKGWWDHPTDSLTHTKSGRDPPPVLADRVVPLHRLRRHLRARTQRGARRGSARP